MSETGPVVFLPGLQGSGEVFLPLMQALEGQCSGLALDLPPGPPAEAAAQLAATISGAVKPPVHIVAGSYGGLVALHFPPKIVRSLVLVGTCPIPDGLPRSFRARAKAVKCLPSELRRRLYQAHLRRSLRVDRVPAPVAEKVLSAALPGDVLMERLNGAGEARARPHPGWPLLWVRGQDDSQIIWDDELVTTHWPSAVIVSVPGGHRPYASHPAEFAEVLREFWDSAHVL